MLQLKEERLLVAEIGAVKFLLFLLSRESVERDSVEADDRLCFVSQKLRRVKSREETNLVRVLDQDVLALGHLHAEICDRAHDTPTIGQRYVELCSKVCRADGRRAENSVACVVARVRAGHIANKTVSASRLGQTVFQDVPDLKLLSTRKDTLHGPL